MNRSENLVEDNICIKMKMNQSRSLIEYQSIVAMYWVAILEVFCVIFLFCYFNVYVVMILASFCCFIQLELVVNVLMCYLIAIHQDSENHGNASLETIIVKMNKSIGLRMNGQILQVCRMVAWSTISVKVTNYFLLQMLEPQRIIVRCNLNNSNNVHTQFNVVLAKHPNILLHLGTKPWLKGSYPKEWSPCVMLKMNDDRQHEMIPKNL
jgi:hypothetical protein